MSGLTEKQLAEIQGSIRVLSPEQMEEIQNSLNVSQVQPEEPVIEEPNAILQGAGNVAAGALRGAAQIGATIQNPLDEIARRERLQKIDEFLQERGADIESLPFGVGKFGAEMAGTAGLGGPLASLAGKFPQGAALAQALRTGEGGRAIRAGAGALTGATGAAMVEPSMLSGGLGAGIGAVLPGAFSGGSRLIDQLLARGGSQGAQERIAQRTLKKSAGDEKNVLVQALRNAETYIPGAKPTAGEAIAQANPPGEFFGSRLSTLEEALEQKPGIGDPLNLARAKSAEVTKRALDPQTGGATEAEQALALENAIKTRADASGPLYQRAGPEQINMEMNSEWVNKKAAETPIFKEALEEASFRAASRPGMREPFPIKKAAEEGAEEEPVIYTVEQLQILKEVLDDMLKNKRSGLKVMTDTLQKSDIKDVQAIRNEFVDMLGAESPTWNKARETHREFSAPVNQTSYFQALAQALESPTGQLTPATFQRVTGRGEESILKKTGLDRYFKEKEQFLTPEQLETISSVGKQLTRTQRLAEMLREVRGSPEISKLSSSPFIGKYNVIGELIESVTGGGEGTRKLLANILTDPGRTADFLERLPPEQKSTILRKMVQAGLVTSEAELTRGR